MIRYTLTCDNAHRFDSWFQNADAFQALADKGHLSCAICGSSKVTKTIMAPMVAAADTPDPGPLEKLRDHVEKTSTYVGGTFAKEARAMHDGDAPDRAIYGEATPEEVRALISDDIPVMPLPFLPRKRTN